MASESVTFNAMLTYVAFSRETSANELIAKACKQFYSIEELQEAKEALWKVGDKDIMPAYVKRRDSTVRSEVDAIIDDILNAMQKLDEADRMPSLAVTPAGMHRMPRVPPAETCSISICERVGTLEQTVRMLSESLSKIQLSPSQSLPTSTTSAPTAAATSSETSAMAATENKSYANIAANLGNSLPLSEKSRRHPAIDQDGYQTVTSGRRHRPPRRTPITGTATSSKLRGAPEPSRDLFVYRVEKDTAESEIKDYLEDHSIEARGVEKKSNPEAKYDSFRVEVNVTDSQKLLDAQFWPVGVCVRKYYGKKDSK